jgi:hypothetical protein
MSTRSAIIIKVKREDIGKVVKFYKAKLPTKLSEWTCYSEKEVGEEKSKEVTLDKPYIGIYCHSDGYFDGVGEVLKELYTDYDKVLNLIVGGHCSVVWFDETRHYANRNGEEWANIKPRKGDTANNVASHIGHNGYVYLFDDGEWKAQNGKDFVDYNENGYV